MGKTDYTVEIAVAAAAHDLDATLVEQVVLVESSGQTHAYRFEPAFWKTYLADHIRYKALNPHRVSASYGLMQVMFPVAVENGYTLADPEHLFVPAIGLEYGCRHLRRLLSWAHGNVLQALAAYNGGKGGNTRAPYRNQSYATKVLSA